jgi:hypothetical protein
VSLDLRFPLLDRRTGSLVYTRAALDRALAAHAGPTATFVDADGATVTLQANGGP